ncbi:MAG: hypothetical protein AAGG57_12150 [Pseudomonadota bacterium]
MEVSDVSNTLNKSSQRASICFVSETGRIENPLKDPSVRYRCYHPAEMLASEGYDCTVVSAAQFHNTPLLNHDVYVFHRPNTARVGFRSVIDTLSKLGAILIADYDDLIFGNEELALVSSAVKNGTLTKERAIKAFKSNLEGLRHFNKVIVSTAPLMAHVREYNPKAQVEVASNVVPSSILSLHHENRTPFLKRSSTSIGYFAGTHSHNQDFPIVEAVLHRVLSENPKFSLLLVGPVSVPGSLAALPNVYTADVVNFLRLPGLMATCSTVIAPLENTQFNSCKSRVKFLEAALSGCRLVASPIHDMVAVGEENLTLPKSRNEWYHFLCHPPHADERRELAGRNFSKLEELQRNDGIKALAGLT